METVLFLGVFASLLITYMTIGIIASRRIKTTTDFFLAGRSLSVPVITATLLATQVGGGMFLGTAQDPFGGSLYIIGMVLGFLVLGTGLAAQLQAFKVTTVGEIFEKAYGSTLLHRVTSVLSVASMMGIIVGQIVAAKSVLLHFGGIENSWLFTVFWLFIIAYTMIGGLAAVALTDFVQISVIVTTFSGICIYALQTNPVSFFSPEMYQKISDLWQSSGISWEQAFRIVTMPVFFSIIEQDLAQRFFAAKSKKAAITAALSASILLLLFAFVPFYFGIQAKLQNLVIADGVSPLLPILQQLTNPFFFVLALCAILSAITSTADSLLCATSSIITTSLSSFCNIKQSVKLSRMVTFGCGIAALVASSFVSSSIISILVNSYEISVSCLFIPLFFCLTSKNLKESAALTSSLFGFFGFLFFKFGNVPTWQPYAITLTLLLSLLGYTLGFMLRSQSTRQR